MILILFPLLIFASSVKHLDEENFDDEMENGLWFIKFYAPWCYHCKQLTPTWDSLAENNQNLNIGRVNCDESPAICQQFGVRMYPSILAIRNSEVAEKNSGIRNYYFLTFWMYRCIYLTAFQWYFLLAVALLSVFGYLIYLIVSDPLPESIDSRKIK